MAEAVYILCFLTSLACALLLLRSFKRSGVRLLLWSSFFFIGMAINNALLFVDRVVLPDVDLVNWRTWPVLIGIALLLYGLIWEAE